MDKITVDQVAWAIRNGDAWIAYLQANGGEVYQSIGASAVELSDEQKYQCICKVLDRVWLALTGNMKRRDLGVDQILDWVDMLQWAVAVMPSGYECQRGVIQTELDDWQSRLP